MVSVEVVMKFRVSDYHRSNGTVWKKVISLVYRTVWPV